MEKDAGLKNLSDYIAIVLKRWQIAVTIFVTVAMSTLILTFQQKNVYQATTKLLIGEGVGQRALGGTLGSYQNYFYEQQEFATFPYIITSAPVAEAVATRLNWINAEQEPELFKNLIGQIRSSLAIERIGDSRLFNISATLDDGPKAQALANAAADIFIQRNLETKLNTFKKSFEWLTDQLVNLEYKLEESQKDLLQYIEVERVTSFGDQPVLPQSALADQTFQESESLLERLNAKKIEIELELENLLRRYTDKHPRVIQLRQELTLTQRKLQSQQGTLKKRDQDRESEAIRMKQKEIKYSILKRKVDINKELYNSLNQKMKEIDIASAINENNIEILEYSPLPSEPLRPRKGRQILLGFFVALGLGIASPILLDYLDPSLRKPEEAEDLLKLPVLSSIPSFEKSGNGQEHPGLPVLDSRSREAEAFRILRTNVRFSFPANSGKTLLITSSGPHEGKSTIAANLALAIAASGPRICLVDADLRLPRLHKIFDVKNDKGLTNFLVGEEKTLESIIQTTPHENLFLLTSGTSSPKPVELLENKKMQEVIDILKMNFDYVLFDSPPAGNLIDASILGSKLDGAIFVLQAGKMSKHLIKGAKAQLDRVNVNLCGVVLNKVELSKKHGYYYYYYHPKADEKELAKGMKPNVSRADVKHG